MHTSLETLGRSTFQMVEATGNQISTRVIIHFPVHLEPAVRVSNVLPKMLTVTDPPKLSPVVVWHLPWGSHALQPLL